MGDVADLLQSLLLNAKPDYQAFRTAVIAMQGSLPPLELARSRVALRLSYGLEQLLEGRAGPADGAVLLRQAIHAYHRRLPLPKALWRILQAHDVSSDLRVIDETDTSVWITADAWKPAWLPGAGVEQLDALAVRRQDESGVGDGVLYAASDGKFRDYQSDAQKVAVHACLFAAPGTTTLVTLPTGSGKSLCALLPAWFDSQGGRHKGGTTLVVVPTVALAIDQEAQARALFRHASAASHCPRSLTGGTTAEERAEILQSIRDGALPVLFTSPESLLQTALYDACLAAARSGTLSRLVVDEAHLVQTWGANFRTEFQFLATYRRQLLEASQGRLRTVLLSATVQRSCEALLERLFSDPGQFTWVGGNRLRPEVNFWFSVPPNLEARRSQVLEALHHVPRPAILYVAAPDEALEWRSEARAHGFKRIAAFTGETTSQDRHGLLRAWNNDEIDLMIATTAFGLGVDKPDVRTVIHACLPENLDRFYQEVGRGGRDGNSSISLLCTTRGDKDIAASMLSKALITPDKAIPRWEGMRRSSYRAPGVGDVLRVDIDSPPYGQPNMRRGPSNRNWNEHTLLLMERARLIAITDTAVAPSPAGEELSPANAKRKAPRPGESESREAVLELQVLQPLITDDPEALRQTLDPVREDERKELDQALVDMRAVVKDAVSDESARCLAYSLADLYANTALACGGCPACRREGRQPYAMAIPADLDLPAHPLPPDPADEAKLAYQLRRAFSGQRELNLLWDGPRDVARLEPLKDLIVALVHAGMQQVLAPGEVLRRNQWRATLVSHLAAQPETAHALMIADWIMPPHSHSLFPLATVVVYSADDERADRLHRALRTASHHELQGQHLIRVAHRDLMLASEFGLFRDRMAGPTITVGGLLAAVRAADNVGLF